MKKIFDSIISPFIILTGWITICTIFFGCLFSSYCKKDYIRHNCNECVYKKKYRIGIACGMMYRIPYNKWKRCPNWNYDSNYVIKSIVMKNQNK